jgi:hypothetical protein
VHGRLADLGVRRAARHHEMLDAVDRVEDLGRPGEQVRLDDHHRRAGVGELMAQQAALQPGVHRHVDGAEPHGGEPAQHGRGAVLADGGDGRAVPDPQRGQRAGHPVRGVLDPGRRVHRAAAVEERAVRIRAEPFVQQPGKRLPPGVRPPLRHVRASCRECPMRSG